MPAVIFHVPDRQREALRNAAAVSGLKMSELHRRFIDHCLRAEVIDSLIPQVSGQIRDQTYQRGV